MEIDNRNKDAFESFCERMLHTGRPAPEALEAYEKHIELINKAWAEIAANPQFKMDKIPVCHCVMLGKTGAGKTPHYLLEELITEMGFPQKELKHPNEIVLEKVNATIEQLEDERRIIKERLSYIEGRRDGLFRAKMYLEEELKKDKEEKE